MTAADLKRTEEVLKQVYAPPRGEEFWEYFPATRALFRLTFGDPVRHVCPGCGGEHSLAEACAWVRR